MNSVPQVPIAVCWNCKKSLLGPALRTTQLVVVCPNCTATNIIAPSKQ